jgi:hypothetical protein
LMDRLPPLLLFLVLLDWLGHTVLHIFQFVDFLCGFLTLLDLHRLLQILKNVQLLTGLDLALLTAADA